MSVPSYVLHSVVSPTSSPISGVPTRGLRRHGRNRTVGGGTRMIALTHFGSGNRIALNVDLIEKIEETPDTVITLTNGTRYLVQETLDEIIERSIEVRARAI